MIILIHWFYLIAIYANLSWSLGKICQAFLTNKLLKIKKIAITEFRIPVKSLLF